MPFDEAKYREPAIHGDIGFNVFVVQHALTRLASAVEKIAEQSNVDVGRDLEAVRNTVTKLTEEVDRLTGWRPE